MLKDWVSLWLFQFFFVHLQKSIAMATVKSDNIKCKSICTGYKWLCDNCIKNLNNYGNRNIRGASKKFINSI